MKTYLHGLGDELPPNFYGTDEDGVAEQVLNLAKTTFVFGKLAIPGSALAELLGLKEPTQENATA